MCKAQEQRQARLKSNSDEIEYHNFKCQSSIRYIQKMKKLFTLYKKMREFSQTNCRTHVHSSAYKECLILFFFLSIRKLREEKITDSCKDRKEKISEEYCKFDSRVLLFTQKGLHERDSNGVNFDAWTSESSERDEEIIFLLVFADCWFPDVWPRSGTGEVYRVRGWSNKFEQQSWFRLW